MSTSEEFDVYKDYYKLLDIPESASQDQVKNSYHQLALRHHPDVAGKENSTKFTEVQEAFHLLSKPEIRLKYDSARRKLSGASFTPSVVSNTAYKSQKTNFDTIQKEAGTHWKTTVDKYKTEKWINMSLSDKKKTRKLPVNSFAGVVIVAGGLLVFTGMLGYIMRPSTMSMLTSNNKKSHS
mmetsp:Transcript_5335/g.5497  ORF Transcript_5335/g.5497 Transcript_5335/m.5497 type:complete len:181 (-) Transcript_5335:170-712(-)